jgi:hypothetical protein
LRRTWAVGLRAMGLRVDPGTPQAAPLQAVGGGRWICGWIQVRRKRRPYRRWAVGLRAVVRGRRVGAPLAANLGGGRWAVGLRVDPGTPQAAPLQAGRRSGRWVCGWIQVRRKRRPYRRWVGGRWVCGWIQVRRKRRPYRRRVGGRWVCGWIQVRRKRRPYRRRAVGLRAVGLRVDPGTPQAAPLQAVGGGFAGGGFADGSRYAASGAPTGGGRWGRWVRGWIQVRRKRRPYRRWAVGSVGSWMDPGTPQAAPLQAVGGGEVGGFVDGSRYAASGAPTGEGRWVCGRWLGGEG